jgi:adenylate cyclase
VVFVGASVPTSPDLHATSTTGDGQMSGTEILANAFDTVRRQAPLRSTGRVVNLVLVSLLALLVPLLALRFSPLRATAIGLAGGVAYLVMAQVAFAAGHVLPVVSPMLGLVVAGGGGLAVHYLGATVERERTRSTFARFVPEDVVSMALARADGDLRLGGERLESTVLFCDLRAFTAWAESREPPEVIDVLNRYLEEMSDAIMDHGGTLVAYMGDGIMAVFGAPLPQDDHADRAFAAAREMLHRRLPRVNASLAESGLDGAFRMGIGLNSGPVMSGNVGSSRRVEYTAVGDTTNTAARLEGMTKGTPHQLFMSDATRAQLTTGADDVVEAGELPVRGRSAPIRIWTLRG